MRWVVIGLGAVVALIVAGFLWTEWQMAGIETPRYEVERSDGAFEVRHYAPMLMANVTVDGSRDEAASKGFRVLADFIFGGNQPQEKIAMTAPVVQAPTPQEAAEGQGESIAMTAPVVQNPVGAGLWQVSFIMPSAYTFETLPVPQSDRVRIETTSGERVAAIRFSGRSNERKLSERTQELEAWMAREGILAAGPPRFAFYDPPWRLPFLRRNEVLIPLAPLEDAGAGTS